jgi:hypothetical protein
MSRSTKPRTISARRSQHPYGDQVLQADHGRLMIPGSKLSDI